MLQLTFGLALGGSLSLNDEEINDDGDRGQQQCDADKQREFPGVAVPLLGGVTGGSF